MLSRSVVALALSAVLVAGLPSERLPSLFARDEVGARSTLVGRSTVVSTPLGSANGVTDASGALRFSVKYASSSRWGPSSVATTWTLPDIQTDPAALPLACPQPGFDSSSSTEDCLSIILYVPPSPAPPSGSMPTLLWIHGGSFIVGSATAPGLDGSSLAIATNSIVAVVQYRLGALGFMAPDGSSNLAVNDIVNALEFLNTVVPSFGGSSSKITIAGQSSGANMVRALLAVPSASSLFNSGILQSDPMDYGFMAIEDQETLQGYFNGLIDCDATDVSCQNGLSVDSIIDAELTLFNNAIGIVPAAGNFEPMRPVKDGELITSPLDSTASFPSVTKPLLISTVNNEAAFAIYGAFPDPLDISLFEPITEATLGSDRTSTVIASSFYSQDGVTDARVLLQTLGTDSIWRCASDAFARSWVAHGGSAYVGQFTVGATYPGNEQVDICTQPGEVCHQDDIEIVFGTVPSPSVAQAALITEIQSRYKAFLNNGNPNVVGYPTWTAATTTNVHSLLLGSLSEIPDSGEAPDNACAPTFWGDAVQFDYQVFGI